MPTIRAWQASEKAKREGKPEVIFVPLDFFEHEKSSHAVSGIIGRHPYLVEQASKETIIDASHLLMLQTSSAC